MVERLARAGLDAAARRWPGDLSGPLRDEWAAELAALRDDPALGRFGRARRMLTFAGSLAVAPAVDQPTWPERAVALGRGASVAAGVTLLAAALFNAVHAVGGPGLLIVAGLLMAALGARVRIPAAGIGLVGPALFAFLFIGNDGAVMPFMGFADVAPAAATWTVLILLTIRLIHGTRGARRVVLAVTGGLIAVDLAVIAGSVHAAEVLGLGAGSAPAWFPLALLPGGTVEFGPFHADGTAAFGTLQASGPAFHASDILLANAAATAGPMLLCTIFVLARAVRGPALTVAASDPVLHTHPGPELRHHRPAARPAGPGAADGTPVPAGPRAVARTPVPAGGRIAVGCLAALGALAVGELLRRSAPAVDTILHRLLDNSAVFGFGFLAHPAGRAGVALLVALLVIRAADAIIPARSR